MLFRASDICCWALGEAVEFPGAFLLASVTVVMIFPQDFVDEAMAVVSPSITVMF